MKNEFLIQKNDGTIVEVEAANKLDAMEQAKAYGTNVKVYVSLKTSNPFRVGNIVAQAITTVGKACTLYGGDSTIVARIGREAKMLNGKIVTCKYDDADEYVSYIYDRMRETSGEAQDMIHEVVAALLETNVTEPSTVREVTYKAVNAQIYGTKKAYNETNVGKGYNNLIQLNDGSIVPDSLQIIAAYRRAIAGTFGSDGDKITSVVHTAIEKLADGESNIIESILSGQTWTATADHYKVTRGKVVGIVERFRRSVLSTAKRTFPEVLNSIRKIVTVEYTDANGEKQTFHVLTKI